MPLFSNSARVAVAFSCSEAPPVTGSEEEQHMLNDTVAGAPLSARGDARPLCCVLALLPRLQRSLCFLPSPPVSVCDRAGLQISGGSLTSGAFLFLLPERVCIQMRDQGVLPEGLSFKDICYHVAEPYDGSEFTADILKASNVAQRSTTRKGLDQISPSCHHLHLSRFLPHCWPFPFSQRGEHEARMLDTIALKSGRIWQRLPRTDTWLPIG